MGRTSGIVVSISGVSVALLASASGAAAAEPINGKLSERGYTVLAFAANGEVSSVQTRRGRFEVRPPTATATLHLRGRDGVYAGPIVVGRRREGKRAVLGVEAGARLGEVEVKGGRGYAKVADRLRRKLIDQGLTARAKNGVPIGAGVFGRVRSTGPRGGGADRDLDGVHEALDIDDDGDLVLDKFDRSGSRRALSAGSENELQLSTAIGAPIWGTPNAHAGVTDAQIEAGLRDFGFIGLNIPAGDSAELDCGAPVPAGLSYCAPGGTGVTDRGRPFPACCDRDNDDFGTMSDITQGPDFTRFGLDHHATTDQIGTGDIVTEHITLSGNESQCPPPTGTSPNCLSLSSMHQYVFATVPAVRSFSDGQALTTVPYPVAPDGPGSPQNPFPVSATGGDVVLTLTFFRPQRRPTSESECSQPAMSCTGSEWIDMGGLVYTATSADAGDMLNDAGWCPKGAFSEADPNLGPGGPEEPGAEGEAGFTDGAADRPANPSNTFTYTFNLTECLDAYGISFNPGETRQFRFQAFTPNAGFAGGSGGVDNAHQSVWFQRAP